MEGSASAPTHPQIELEPPEWQPRAMWVSARLLCGAVSFFLVAFVFAYFYLRSLDSHRDWKIGTVNPSLGYGIAIVVSLILSAAAMSVAASTPARTVTAGSAALVLALLAAVLQVIQWTTLGFGPASGGYASVYVGWTAMYTVLLLVCAFWIETQVAGLWRRRREGVGATSANVLTDEALVNAGLKACSFFWSYYVATGVLLFVVLYVL